MRRSPGMTHAPQNFSVGAGGRFPARAQRPVTERHPSQSRRRCAPRFHFELTRATFTRAFTPSTVNQNVPSMPGVIFTAGFKSGRGCT